jgi:hypothetical protein
MQAAWPMREGTDRAMMRSGAGISGTSRVVHRKFAPWVVDGLLSRVDSSLSSVSMPLDCRYFSAWSRSRTRHAAAWWISPLAAQ